MVRRDRYEVAATRRHLVRVLVETGWDAPEEVLAQVKRDEKVLRRQAGTEAQPWAEFLRPATHRQPPRRRRDFD